MLAARRLWDRAYPLLKFADVALDSGASRSWSMVSAFGSPIDDLPDDLSNEAEASVELS